MNCPGNNPLIFALFYNWLRNSFIIRFIFVTFHSESLSRTSLAVREHCRMITLEKTELALKLEIELKYF